jgi:hypothetical protein
MEIAALKSAGDLMQAARLVGCRSEILERHGCLDELRLVFRDAAEVEGGALDGRPPQCRLDGRHVRALDRAELPRHGLQLASNYAEPLGLRVEGGVQLLEREAQETNSARDEPPKSLSSEAKTSRRTSPTDPAADVSGSLQPSTSVPARGRSRNSRCRQPSGPNAKSTNAATASRLEISSRRLNPRYAVAQP